jgi:tetratricopeptide (TPR) repeat protein
MRLEQNHQVSRLILQADSPLEFQVELKNPRLVVVHLPGADLKAEPPATGNDPLVQSLENRPEPGGGFMLLVHTRTPGVTVLPVYDATSRQLTLELGGAPAVEEAVAGQKPASESAPPPTPVKPEEKPAPASRRPQPIPKTQPKKTIAKPAPAPVAAPSGPAPAPVSAGPAPQVKAVRLGTHPDYTRLVLEADAAITAQVSSQGKTLRLSLKQGRILPSARLPRQDRRILGIRVLEPNPLELELTLARPLDRQRLFRLQEGKKLVLDMTLAAPGSPGQTQAKAPPASPPTQAPADNKGASLTAKPQAKPAPAKSPAPQPPQPQTAAAAAPAQTVSPQARAVTGQAVTGPPAPPQAAAGKAKASPPDTQDGQGELHMVSEAHVPPETPQLARGLMPPVPPPSPLAHPRGPLDQGPAAAPAGPQAPSPGQAPASAEKVIARVQEAQEQKTAGKEAALPQPQAPRPPQAAVLGPKAVEDKKAKTLFNRAKEALDGRRYDEALNLFETFLLNYPKHALAQEATFRKADAFFYLHERKILPVYDQVMENYQIGVDLYPESDQVPWAFLMMGKAAMLAQETYKAAGYFQLVIEDFPKSKYVPLALVSRGQAHLNQGKWLLALDEFREVASKYPDSLYRKDADWGQAQALFAMSRYQRASLVLKDMDRRNPKLRLEEPELLYYIGEAEFQMKNYPEARAYFLWALNIKPDLADNDIILARVGDTYQFEDAHKAARDIYTRVLEMFPETDGALVSRIRLAEAPTKDEEHPWGIYQVKPTTDAFKVYREIVEKYPDRPVAELAQVKIGVYYYKKKQYQKSLDSLNRVLQTHPRTNFRREINYTMNLAVMGLLNKLKAEDKALKLMDTYLNNRSLLTRPNSNQVLRLLSWAYEKAGLNARAAKLYQVLVSRGIKEPQLSLDLARNLMKVLDYAGVAAALEPGVLAKLKGDAAIKARSLLGRAYIEMGLLAKAEAMLRSLLKISSNHPQVARDYYALGRVLAKRGKAEESLAALSQAEKLLADKQDPELKLLRYLVAMEAGLTASKLKQVPVSLRYFRRAESLAPSDQEKAQAMYEQARVYQSARMGSEMATTLTRLAKMKVEPWSEMADRLLTDLQMAPRLAGVGQ